MKGLFNEQLARKPDNYPWAKDFIDAIWHGFWTPDEFTFTADKNQFYQLTDEQQGVISRDLSAIAQIEIAVKTFWANLGRNLPHPSISDLGFAMANCEVIHNLAYEKLLDVLRLTDIFEENLKHPVFGDRVKYLRKYADKAFQDERKQYIYSVILFTLFVENASLFSQFFVIMHFNRFHNVLKDTAQQVQYTRLEENLHANVGIKLINTLRDEYPELFDSALDDRIQEEVAVAIETEGRVIEWILQGYHEEGLNADVLKAFIKKRIIDGVEACGFEAPELTVEEQDIVKLHTQWFDEEMLGSSMTDFFQKRPVEYSKNNRSYDLKDLI